MTTIAEYAFYNCSALTDITIPALVTANDAIGKNAFNGCSAATVVLSSDAQMNFLNDTTGLLNCKAFGYPRAHAADWKALLGDRKFAGYTETLLNVPEVTIKSAKMRATDSSVLDVTYRVACTSETVKVRALAFKDGVRSLEKVIRPSALIDNTELCLGDAMTANADHALAWRVTTDWKTDLGKFKFDVLAKSDDLLPLELITIPADGTHAAMTVSWNRPSPARIINALYWLYAAGDSGLTLSEGVLKNGDKELMNGTTLYPGNALEYIYSKMGFSVLSGDDLTYARTKTGLALADETGYPFAKQNN